MDTRRKTAIITFVIIAALWLFMVMHGTLGFERLDDAHAKFVDVIHTLVWIAFLISGWRLYAALRTRRA